MATGIEVILSVVDKGSKPIKGLIGMFDKFGKQIIVANQAVELFGRAISALSAPFESVINEGREFTKQMSVVKSISKITADEFNALEAEAKRIGETTAFTATQAARGMEELTRAGFDAAKTIEIAADAMDLAAAQGTDLADTSRLVGIGFKLFADQGLNANDIVNNFNKSVGSSAQNMGDFIEAFKFAASTGAAVNQPLDEITKTIALLADVGFKGTLAGTGLRSAMSRLVNPTNEARKVLKELGLSLEDVSPESNKLTEVFKKLNEAGISSQQALELFGQEAGGKFIKIIQDINPLLENYEKKFNNAKTAQESARDSLNNLDGDITIFGSALSGLKLEIFDVLEDGLRSGTQAATALTKSFTEFVKNNRELVANIFQGISDAIKTFIEFGKRAAIILIDVVRGFQAFFELETIQEIFKAWGRILDNVIETVLKLASDVGDFFLPIWNQVKIAFESVIAITEPLIKKIVDFAKVITEAVISNENIQSAIADVVQIFQVFWEIIAPILGGLFDLGKEVLPLVIDVAGTLFNIITKLVKSALNILRDIVQELSPLFRSFINWIKDIRDTMKNWLDVILNPLDTFAGILDGLFKSANDVTSASKKTADSQVKLAESFKKADKEASALDETLTGNTLVISLRDVQTEAHNTLSPLNNFAQQIDSANQNTEVLDFSLENLAKNLKNTQNVAQKGINVSTKVQDLDLSGTGGFSLGDIFSTDAIRGIGEDFGKQIAQQIPGVSGAISGLQAGGPLGAAAGFFGELLMKTEGFQETMRILGESLIELMEPLGKVLIPIAKFIARIIRRLSPFISRIAQVLSDLFDAIMPLIDLWLNLMMPLWETLLDIIVTFFEALKPVFEALQSIIEALKPILDDLKPVLQIIGEVLTILAPLLKQLFKPLVMWLKLIAFTITFWVNFFKGVFNIWMQWINFARGIINIVVRFIKSIVNAVKVVTDIIKKIFKLVEDILGAIGNIAGGAGGFLGLGGGGGFLGLGGGGGGFLGFQTGTAALTRSQLLRLPGMEAGSGLIKAHVGEKVIPAGESAETGNTFIFKIKAIDPMSQKEELRQVMESLFLERRLGVT